MIMFVLACQPPASVAEHLRQTEAETAFFSNILAQYSNSMATIVEVEVQTSQEAIIFAEVHLPNGTSYSTVATQGSKHHFTLGGIPEEQTISVQLHGETESSGVFEVTTGTLDFQPSIFTTLENDFSGLITTVLSGEEQGIAMWNAQAELVWSIDLSDEERTPVQAHYQVSTGLITYNLFSADHNDPAGELISIDLMGQEITRVSTPLQHHAFTPIDQSTMAYLSIDVRDTDEYGPVVGDSIIIVDETGQQNILFSSWDHFAVSPTPVWNLPFYPQGKDWTHASGLTYNSEEALFTLSLMGMQAVLNIDTNGDIKDVFAGSNLPQTTHPISDPPLVRPHGGKWTGHRLLVFHSPELQSQGSILNTNGSAFSWEQHFTSDIHALALGDIHEIEDDMVLVNFGTSGQLQIFTAQNTPIFTLENTLGSYFSHANWVRNIYHSSSP